MITNNKPSQQLNKSISVTLEHVAHKKVKDIQYLQINKISFQHNFKLLMGHYKENNKSTPALPNSIN